MSSLWPTVVLLVAVLVAYSPQSAATEIKGELTTEGGSTCQWREKSSSGSSTHELRLTCKCNKKKYSCHYIFNTANCKDKEKNNAYKGHEAKFYSLFAIDISSEFRHTYNKMSQYSVTDLP